MGGPYEYMKFQKAASGYCATNWDTLRGWYEKKLYPKADKNRFRFVLFRKTIRALQVKNTPVFKV